MENQLPMNRLQTGEDAGNSKTLHRAVGHDGNGLLPCPPMEHGHLPSLPLLHRRFHIFAEADLGGHRIDLGFVDQDTADLASTGCTWDRPPSSTSMGASAH